MKNIVNEAIRQVISHSNELSQSLTGGQGKEEMYVPEIAPVCRSVAADGIVLLKNEDSTLPIKPDEEVSVFGRCAIDLFSVGYGSGGDVMYPYKRNLIDGLLEDKVKINIKVQAKYEEWTKNPVNIPDPGIWGKWPMNYPEMPLSEDMVREASLQDEKAIYVLGRAAGEDRDSTLTEGSYYITSKERKALETITKYFKKTILIFDCGNIVDLSFLNDFGEKISAIVYAFPGGMEMGNALADLLCGKVNFSGHLSSTIAKEYSYYPSSKDFGGKDFNNYTEDIFVGYRYFETFKKDEVLFPFGFGLSYTTFSIEFLDGDNSSVRVNVKNTGSVAGREVVLCFIKCPDGKIGKPFIELAGFKKTRVLEPLDTEELTIEFDLKWLSSYDDSGVTGHKNSFLIEKGKYSVFVGENARDINEVYSFSLEEDKVSETLDVLGPSIGNSFERIVNNAGELSHEKVMEMTSTVKDRIEENLPDEIKNEPENIGKYTWNDVSTRKISLDEFISSLTDDELISLTKGGIEMDYGDRAKGNAGAFGGTSESLKEKGVPYAVTTDGPSGIRIKHTATLLPSGNLFACTFDPKSVENLYSYVAKEMHLAGSDVLLAPGMNIQRNPLCGRNFEYFSEDPLLSGVFAAAVVNGLSSGKSIACPKHFAGNNQEMRRNHNDTRVSERALREIYLRNFEIMISLSKPRVIMTSYNMINGVYSHYNYDLVETVLRKEWGYNGLIITDWWMQAGESKEFPGIKNDSYRVRSGVDVLMPGGDGPWPNSKIGHELNNSIKNKDGIRRSEIARSVRRVLEFLLELSDETTKNES